VNPDHTVFTIFGMIMYYFSTAPLASQIWKRSVLRPEIVAERSRAVLAFLKHGLFLANIKTRSVCRPPGKKRLDIAMDQPLEWDLK
jgi:hypothetical protein